MEYYNRSIKEPCSLYRLAAMYRYAIGVKKDEAKWLEYIELYMKNRGLDDCPQLVDEQSWFDKIKSVIGL